MVWYINGGNGRMNSTNMYECKRYAVTLKDNDLLIGVVDMGLEETVNEVEMAYFIDDDYRGNGYAAESLQALFSWCMSVSSLPYMILTIDCANKTSCMVAEKSRISIV